MRVDLAERVLVTWLVLDTTPSMQFGTAERRKADVAEGVAIAIGHLATRREPARIVTFGDESTYAIPPRQGRVALLGLLKAVREEEGGHGTGATSLGEALDRAGGLARQKSLAVVVSDFRGPRDWRRPLLDLAGRHDVVAVEVRDPREQELSNVGLLWLVDPETGRQLRVDTRSRNSGNASPRLPLPSARSSRRRSPRPASGTSCCRPPVTGCARSSPSSAGAARELRVADRAARARGPSAARRRVPLAGAATGGVAGPVREPGPPPERDRPRAGEAAYLPLGVLLVGLGMMIFGVARPHAIVTVRARRPRSFWRWTSRGR